MDFEKLVQVDIATGGVRTNHLDKLWLAQEWCVDQSATTPAGRQVGANAEALIKQRVKDYNLTGRKRRHKRAWTERELYRLAVLITLRQLRFHQAAAQLGKTTEACRKAFRQLKKAGVI